MFAVSILIDAGFSETLHLSGKYFFRFPQGCCFNFVHSVCTKSTWPIYHSYKAMYEIKTATLICSFNRNLNNGEPFLWVFLVPGAVDVAGAMLSDSLVALFLHIAEELGERLVEALVGADVLHAEHLGDGGQTLELNDCAVLSHRFYLLTILNIDVHGFILLVVLDGEAVAWRRTLAAETLHLWPNLLIKHGSDGRIVGDDLTMTCHDDFGQ